MEDGEGSHWHSQSSILHPPSSILVFRSACRYSAHPMSELSREQFATRVIEIVHERFPLVKIGAGDGGFSITVNGAVAPLENLYRVAILHPQEIKHHVERWAVELLRAAEGTPDAGANFEDVKDRILPMLVRATAAGTAAEDGPAGGVISQPLVEGLLIAYAIDQD